MINFFKGVAGGIGNIVPGLSGSALLVILGIYDKCIDAISNLFKDFKNSFKFLFPIGCGILFGTFVFANIIEVSLNNFSLATSIIFVGFMIGTLPSLFKQAYKEKFKKIATEYNFTDKDLECINALVNDKYSTYEWNVGRSPKAKNKFEYKFPFGIFTLNFDVEKGKIFNAQIFGDFFAFGSVDEFNNKLNGVPYIREEVEKALVGIERVIKGACAKEIADKMFIE